VRDIETYLAERNANPKPYKWKAEGAEILSKIKRARAALAAFCSGVIRPRSATLFAEHLGSRVFAVIRHGIFFLSGRDAHDVDGVADHIGRALLAFWASRHDAPHK
jgi:hypothetical protein